MARKCQVIFERTLSGASVLAPQLRDDNVDRLLVEADSKSKREIEKIVGCESPREEFRPAIRKRAVGRGAKRTPPDGAPGIKAGDGDGEVDAYPDRKAPRRKLERRRRRQSSKEPMAQETRASAASISHPPGEAQRTREEALSEQGILERDDST